MGKKKAKAKSAGGRRDEGRARPARTGGRQRRGDDPLAPRHPRGRAARSAGGGRQGRDESQGVRQGARAPARGAGRAPGVGQAHGGQGLRAIRGARRRRQGRDHQAPHRAHQPARLPRGGAAGADRAGEVADVHPALPAPPPRRRRGRALRPQLVQPRGGRAGDGLHPRGRRRELPAVRAARWSGPSSPPASSWSSTGSR